MDAGPWMKVRYTKIGKICKVQDVLEQSHKKVCKVP
jgi:hypothetical protein